MRRSKRSKAQTLALIWRNLWISSQTFCNKSKMEISIKPQKIRLSLNVNIF